MEKKDVPYVKKKGDKAPPPQSTPSTFTGPEPSHPKAPKPKGTPSTLTGPPNTC